MPSIYRSYVVIQYMYVVIHVCSYMYISLNTSFFFVAKQLSINNTYLRYFSCRICNGEVKHNYKNIMMHLQRSHQLTPAAYQQQFNTKKHSRQGQSQEFMVTNPGAGFASLLQYFLLIDILVLNNLLKEEINYKIGEKQSQFLSQAEGPGKLDLLLNENSCSQFHIECMAACNYLFALN